VPLGSLLQRLERFAAISEDDAGPATVGLPMPVNSATWAAISPPRGGWSSLEPTSSALLESIAKAGIDEVATAIPEGTGEQIVHRVRNEVWGRPIPGFVHIPAGAAFAAVSLGFLGAGEIVTVHESGPWTRLTSTNGHVLVKRRAWTLSR
jgi:hypothetical protein